MINGFVSAMRTLTRIPIWGKDAKKLASSLTWFPVVGFLLATFLSGIVFFFNKILSPNWNEGIALLIILCGTILTGALHLDGFADWADSLGAKPNKERMLAIMKDSNSGAFGVVAISLLLLAKWIAVVKLLDLNLAIVGLFIAYISSRFSMVYLSVLLPYARAEGGTGEPIIKGATTKHLIIALIVSMVLLYFIGSISAILIFFLGFLIASLWKQWCKKYFSGITGDLLGAGSEFVEALMLFAVVLFYNSINSLTKL